MRLLPGVRLNVTKNGIGLGFGGHGVRYSMHSTGRETFSAGLPGTGLYWTESRVRGKRDAPGPATEPVPLAGDGPDAAARGPVGGSGGFTASQSAETIKVRIVRSLPEIAAAARALPDGSNLADTVEALHATLTGTTPSTVSEDLAGLRGRDSTAGDAVRGPSDAPTGVGVQPLPGFELVLPLAPDVVLLACACHLLAHGNYARAESLISDEADSDMVLLLRMAARMHADDPVSAVAVGVPALDDPVSWLAGLIRAQALMRCHRSHEADEVLDDLSSSTARCGIEAGPLTEVLDVLVGRRILKSGDPLAACRAALRVLASDPLDAAALTLLADAQRAAADSAAAGTAVSRHEDEEERARLTVVLASLEAELQGAQRTLLDVVEDLEQVADLQARKLDPRELEVARLKARLTRLIADLSGDPDDAAIAAVSQDHFDEASEHQRQREETFQEAFEDEPGAGPATDAHANGMIGDEEQDRDAGDRGRDDAQEGPYKSLRRALIKRWHPDRAVDEEDRRRRTAMTTLINQMWKAKDWAGLQRLWDRGTVDLGAVEHGSVAQLEAAIEKVRAELVRTREEIDALLRSPLEQLRQAMDAAATDGRDLIGELAEELDREIAELQVAIEELESGATARTGTPP